MQTSNGILMIEPCGRVSDQPLVDELTRKMAAAWRNRRDGDIGYRGFHICACGAFSDSKDHWIGELLTNSLAIHYLAYHRYDVPEEELEKVRALSYGEAEPTPQELAAPGR